VKILAEGSYGKVLLARNLTEHSPLLVAFKVFLMQVNEDDIELDEYNNTTTKIS
jgi:hypothetical protein